jgi:hypothetical protein
LGIGGKCDGHCRDENVSRGSLHSKDNFTTPKGQSPPVCDTDAIVVQKRR